MKDSGTKSKRSSSGRVSPAERIAQTLRWAADYWLLTREMDKAKKRREALRGGSLKNLQVLKLNAVEGEVENTRLKAQRYEWVETVWNLDKFRAMLAKRGLREDRFLKIAVNEKEVEKALNEGVFEVPDLKAVSKTEMSWRFRVDEVKPETEEQGE